MKIILGINAYHADSSACILVDGKLIAAIEEERINRIKNWSGFPVKSINLCLDYAKINLNDLKCIAINRNTRSNIKQKVFFSIQNLNNFKYALKKSKNLINLNNIENHFLKEFELSKLNPKIIFVDHHLSHIASSFLTSKFKKFLSGRAVWAK